MSNLSMLAKAGFLAGLIALAVPVTTHASTAHIVLDIGMPGDVYPNFTSIPIQSSDLQNIPADGSELTVNYSFNDGNLLELSQMLLLLGSIKFSATDSSNEQFPLDASLSLLDAAGNEIEKKDTEMYYIAGSFAGASASFDLTATTIISGFTLTTMTPDIVPGMLINTDFGRTPAFQLIEAGGVPPTAIVVGPSPVPLPASILLLLGAVGSLALSRGRLS